MWTEGTDVFFTTMVDEVCWPGGVVALSGRCLLEAAADE